MGFVSAGIEEWSVLMIDKEADNIQRIGIARYRPYIHASFLCFAQKLQCASIGSNGCCTEAWSRCTAEELRAGLNGYACSVLV